MLKGKKIYLRQLEEFDVNLILLWENDLENWRYSESEAPFSFLQIQKYVENASRVRQNEQLRFMICRAENDKAIGTIDLYKIDFKNNRAGVGILIADAENREQGFAFEALDLLSSFAQKRMSLHQLYCDIQANNEASIALFEKNGYEQTGTRKDWYFEGKNTIDAYFYQKLL